MYEIMKGVGLAHELCQSLQNSEAACGERRNWNNQNIKALTTKQGKKEILGPLLDVVRGDAEIVLKRRVIIQNALKPGDVAGINGNGTIVRNRVPKGKNKLVVGNFTLGVASRSRTEFYKKDSAAPETHIDVPHGPYFTTIDKRRLLPNHIIGQELPGIAVRDFYLENPHYIPECFGEITLFFGTICKNDLCYFVPGIHANGEPYGRRICFYEVVDGKDVLKHFDNVENDVAVFL